MQTGNNDMDKKLRQLENQSLPDLSKQDSHWQQMKQLLTSGAMPPAVAPKPSSRKWWPWLIAAAILSVVTLTVFKLTAPSGDKQTIAGTTKAQPTASSTTGTIAMDTIGILADPPVVISDKTISHNKHRKIQVSAPTVTNSGNPAGRDTAMPVPVVTNQPVISKKETVTLAGFLKQIEKQAQEIIIDPGIDNLVKGTAGTALMIPAHTFPGDDKITILLKEFYSYEDIITNKLSTTSNGEQLVTGGMLHIQAFAKGKEISIDPGRSIRWFIPDSSKNMDGMELFSGNKHNTATINFKQRKNAVTGMDTAALSDRLEIINWIPDKQPFIRTYLKTTVKVLDLKDDPYKTRETKKGYIGKFHISANAKISRKELETQLKEKYGYYKVKIRNSDNDRHRFTYSRKADPISGSDSWNAYEDVGDSAWIDKKLAARYKLKATDSITYAVSQTVMGSGQLVKKSFTGISLNELADKYSVDIRTLGWINCDRFYRDSRPKMDYYVNIGDTAANYYTVMVFEQMKSMIMGYSNGNQVVFSNLPKGVKGKVLSIGIQQGKPVAAVANLPADSNTIDMLKFEETSPASFREQAAMIDK